MKTYRSVPDMFLSRVAESCDRLAYKYPVGENWHSMTWKEAEDRVRAISCGLLSLGVDSEERCAIVSNTRVEWLLADLGILCAAGATTTVYPSNTADECAYILNDSNTKVVFAEDDEQVAKLVAERSNLQSVEKVVTFEGKSGHDGWVITLAELEEIGKRYNAENPDRFETVANSVEKDQLATLIYTSGTTGRPKGVELLHDCWVYEGEAVAATGTLNIHDVQYLWLPLSHSMGKVLQSLQLAVGFVTAVDGRIPKLVDNLAVIRPTFMAAAPRIFEKVYNKIVTGAQAGGPLKYKIFRWALDVGRPVSKLRQEGKEPSGLLALKYKIATKLVFSKIQDRFGGRLRFFVSGSAPLSRDIAEFFHAAGILILEGYGLTETSAASFVSRPDLYRFGWVGPPVPGTEVKIAPEDGEVLIRGRGVMRGYHNMPEATKETLSDDGWLRTGDIGEVDSKGLLRITDRKKDLIKTSGGKYVAPQALESKLKALCPYVSQVVVHGNARNYCSALITIDEESIRLWAQDRGLNGSSYEQIIAHGEVKNIVQKSIDELNEGLASYETIKKFAILPRDLTVEDGDLTPSLKVKRKIVEQKFASVLDGFYSDSLRQM